MKRAFAIIIAISMMLTLLPDHVSAAELKSTAASASGDSQSSFETKETITGFDEESSGTRFLEYPKGTNLDDILADLPDTMSVFLNDSHTPKSIDVTWECVGDYNETNYYYYQFLPKWKDKNYSLSDTLEEKQVPYIGVFLKSGKQGSMNAHTDSVTGNANETTIYNFLRNTLGLNVAASCGILANIQSESSFDPTAHNKNDSGGTQSYGICQWNSGTAAGNRFGLLQSWCSSNGYSYTSLTGQLQYMKHELESTSYYRYSTLKTGIENSNNGAYQASKIWSQFFEGCASVYYEPRATLARDRYWPAYSGDTDKTPPTISNVQVTDLSASGYTVTCTVTDNVGVTSVKFPTFPASPTSWDPAVWMDGTLNGTTASFRVNISDHGNATNLQYATHIYAYDAAGNSSSAGTSFIWMDGTAPTITDVDVVTDENGYTITCTVNDESGIDHVQFPTWTNYNGQDDLEGNDGTWRYKEVYRGSVSGNKATYRVNISDHNNEKGLYCTHIYAHDKYGNETAIRALVTVGENSLQKTKATEKYKGNTYLLLENLFTTWDEAKTYSQSLGGHLVTIADAEEQKAVADLVSKGTLTDYWMGATDEAKEGTWKWVTGEEVTYNNWKEGEPNNYNDNEDYADFIQETGKWNDLDNGHTADGKAVNGLICEIEGAEEYSITYHLDGGTNNSQNPSTYPADQATLDLKSPTKDHCTFLGWYTSEVGGEEFTSQTQCSGDLDLYARWEIEKYTITFDVNGGNALTTSTRTVDYDSVYDTLPVPVRTGYTFDGWFDARTGGKAVTKDTICKGNQTIYAHWTEVKVESEVKVTVGSRKGTPGAEVTVPVSITKNPGIAGFSFDVNYDDKVLTLKSVTPGSLTTKGEIEVSENTINWYTGNNAKGDGILFNLVFKVAEDTEAESTEITISMHEEKKNLVDENGNYVEAEYQSGNIVFTQGMDLGDLNGDSDITIGDVVLLNRHVLGKMTLEGSAKNLADLNGDGDVTIGDVVLLNRFVLGKITTLSSAGLQSSAKDSSLADFDLRDRGKEKSGDAMTKETDVKIQTESKTVSSGGQVEVPVRITNNSGIAGLALAVNVPKGFTLDSITAGELLSEGTFDVNGNQCTWYTTDNIQGDGTLLVLHLSVSKEAESGSITVDLVEGKANNLSDENGNTVNAEFLQGTLTVDERSECERSGHIGGIATCKETAVCSRCGEHYGEVNPANHTGNTEVRNARQATSYVSGYTGNTYCKDCGVLLSRGSTIPRLTAGAVTPSVPAKVSAVKAVGTKKKATVRFNSATGAARYQVAYSLKKNFGRAKVKTVYGTTVTLKKLKSRKVYYIRVRAVGSNGSTGSWSSARKVKVK